MGNGKDFFSRDQEGRESEYETIGKSQTVDGIKGSLIKRKKASDTHYDLPYYANSSQVYFRKNFYGICQARVYVGQKKYLDFDWSHEHRNPDGRKFPKGTIHVQMWQENSDGTFSRLSDAARGMNNVEIKKYKGIIKAFCPDVKFR